MAYPLVVLRAVLVELDCAQVPDEAVGLPVAVGRVRRYHGAGGVDRHGRDVGGPAKAVLARHVERGSFGGVVQDGDRAVRRRRPEQQAAARGDLELGRHGVRPLEQGEVVGLMRLVAQAEGVLHPGRIVLGHVAAVKRSHVQAPAAGAPVLVPTDAADAHGVRRGVVQPRVQHVHLARGGVCLHVGDPAAGASDGVVCKKDAIQPVRLHNRRPGAHVVPGAAGAQVYSAVGGVDLHHRCAGAARRRQRARHVIFAQRRDGVDHPLQFRGRPRVDHIDVRPLLRRGVYPAVPADLDRDRLVGQRRGSQQCAGRRVVRHHARVGVVPDDSVQYPGGLVKRHVVRPAAGLRRVQPAKVHHEYGDADVPAAHAGGGLVE